MALASIPRICHELCNYLVPPRRLQWNWSETGDLAPRIVAQRLRCGPINIPKLDKLTGFFDRFGKRFGRIFCLFLENSTALFKAETAKFVEIMGFLYFADYWTYDDSWWQAVGKINVDLQRRWIHGFWANHRGVRMKWN